MDKPLSESVGEAGTLPMRRELSGLGESFGHRLRAARLAARAGKGLGQGELAEAMGISQATVSDYERGRRRPPLDMLVRLADFLGVSAGWLLTAEPETSAKRPAVLQTSIADLLGLTTLTWLGAARLGLPAVAGDAAAEEWPDPFEKRPEEGARAAEDPAAYGRTLVRPAGETLFLAEALCPGARSALVYTGPPHGGLAPGDILLVDPTVSDAARWRLALVRGAGQEVEGSYAAVPAGAALPLGSEPRGTIVGLLRRSR